MKLPLNASLNLRLSSSNAPQSSVKPSGPTVEGYGGGGANVADDALVGLAPLLDFLVELLEVLDRLVRFVQQALSLLQPLLRLRNVVFVITTHPRLASTS